MNKQLIKISVIVIGALVLLVLALYLMKKDQDLSLIHIWLEKVQIERQAELAKAIEGFLASELPDYHVVDEKQSQLEQLLRELTPDLDKYAERLLDANNELMRQLSPHSQRPVSYTHLLWVTLFERHGLAGLKLRHGSYSAESVSYTHLAAERGMEICCQ